MNITDDTARKLSEAIDRLAGAVERAIGMGNLGPGLHIYHHDAPSSTNSQLTPQGPYWSGGGSAGNSN